MKKLLISSLLFFILIHFVDAQQDSLSLIPTPDFPGEPMSLNENNYSLVPIPTENAVIKTDRKGNASLMVAEIKDLKSELKLKQGKNCIIVNHVASNFLSMNPKSYFKFFKLEIDDKKKVRTFIVGGTYFSNQAREKHPLQESIALKFKKVRENTYLIELDGLEPGEYAISTANMVRFYTFSIE